MKIIICGAVSLRIYLFIIFIYHQIYINYLFKIFYLFIYSSKYNTKKYDIQYIYTVYVFTTKKNTFSKKICRYEKKYVRKKI